MPSKCVAFKILFDIKRFYFQHRLELANQRISSLTNMIQSIRTQQTEQQALATYSRPEGAYGGRSSPPALALAEGNWHCHSLFIYSDILQQEMCISSTFLCVFSVLM